MPRLSTFGHIHGYSKAIPSQLVQLESDGTEDAYVIKYNSSGKALWAVRIHSTGTNDLAYWVDTDSSGNVYVTGSFGSTVSVSFYNADGSYAGILLSAGSLDVFLVKYNSAGIFQWNARIAGSGSDVGRGLTVDGDGNVIITGSYTGTNTLYNADTTAFASTLANAGNTDIFVAKYNPSGVVQWGARISTTGIDVGYGVATDSSGNIFISGTHTATATLYNADGTSFGTTVANAGSNDALFAKYNSSGVVQWGARVAFTSSDIGYAVATDSSGNVYFGGAGSGGAGVAVAAYNSDGTAFATTIGNAGLGDAWVVKYNTDGFVQWFVRIASAGGDQTNAIAVDSGGNIYAAGSVGGASPTFYNPDGSSFGSFTSLGGADAWIAKYNNDGAPQWFARLGSAVADLANSLAIDSNDNVYMIGQIAASSGSFSVYNSSAAGSGLASTITSAGSTDGFLVKYNSTGAVQWATKIASSDADFTNAVAVDPSGNVLACGRYIGSSGMFIYGRSISLFSTIPNGGAEDAVLVKYNKYGAPQWAGLIASTSSQQIFANASDSLGNVYITGTYASATTVPVYNADGSEFASMPSSATGDVFIIKYNSIGVVQWIRRLTGSTGANTGFGIAVDSSGNVHVAGSYTGTLTILNGDGTTFGTLTNDGSTDAFVVKYNTDGTPQWRAKISSTAADTADGICVDSSGNVYVAATASSSATTAYNSDDTTLKTFTARGGTDVVLIKYNSSGVGQWGAQIAGTSADSGLDVAVDSSGNTYITGSYTGTGTVYNSNDVSFGTLPNAGSTDVFVVKYDTSGTAQWARRMGSTGADVGDGIAVDLSGNVYVTGQYSASFNVYAPNNTTIFTTLAHGGLGDGFLVKYNTSGTAQWACRMSSTSPERGYAVATDSFGGVYVAGVYTGSGSATVLLTITNANGSTGINTSGRSAVIKFNNAGTALWSQTVNNLSSMRGISTTPYGDCYIGGASGSGSTIQVMNTDTTVYKILSSPGSENQDVFIVKYSSNGVPQWAARLSGTGTDTGGAVATDSSKNTYVVGRYTGTMSIYNANGSVFATTLAGVGSTEIFVVKYSPTGTVVWATRLTTSGADIGFGVGVDSSDNVYVAGQYTGILTAYNADGTSFATTLAHAGAGDACLVKYNSSGAVQWVARLASTGADLGIQIAISANNNVCIAGQYTGTLTAYNADASSFATTLTHSGVGDGFVAVYNSSGSVQWVARMSSTAADSARAVDTDSSDNVYVSGRYASTLTIYNSDGTAFATTLANSGSSGDAFLVKYNSTGTVQWVTRILSSNQDESFGLAVNSDGDSYITGLYSNTVSIYNAGGTSLFTTLANVGTATLNPDVYLVKYNTSGTAQWAGRAGVPGTDTTDQARGITLDGAGNVIITGSTETFGGAFSVYNPSDNTLFGAISSPRLTSETDTFILKYNSSGTVQWMSSTGGLGINAGEAVATDTDGNIYVIGNINPTSSLIGYSA
jgi:hypothetical protein